MTKFPGLIGFDNFFHNVQNPYPPYNLLKTEDGYCLQLAVAGFNKEEVSVSVREDTLLIRGEKREKRDVEYLHKGIGSRSFRREFTVARDVEVSESTLVDGILHVHLKKVEPNNHNLRYIPIN